MPATALQANRHGELRTFTHSEHMPSMNPPHSPSSGSVGWKSLLRLGNQSSKKLTNGSTLTLDTNALSSEASSTTLAPLPSNSGIPDQRSSYHSSLSTDSNSRPSKNSSSLRTPSTPSYMSQHLDEGEDANKGDDSKAQSRSKSKSDKHRNGKSRVPLTANPSQMSFTPASPPATSRSGPLSPKAIGANATRFIRRVASAPNAKGLFTLGSRSTATTKNGLLAPGDMMPPQPEQESSSLETISSNSSRGRPTRPTRANSSNSVLKTKDRVTSVNAATDGPGKIAFRRTYSSHSIKVREVSRKITPAIS
jgi:protein-serine/threonine kinase